MTRCYEVSSRRYIATDSPSRTIYNRETDTAFPCKDRKLFESLTVGDYMGIDKNGNVFKRISKESVASHSLNIGCDPVTIKNSN